MSKAIPFRALPIGGHFKFPEPRTFSATSKKVSSRCYVWSGKKAIHVAFRGGGGGYKMRTGLLKSCVGTVNVAVIPSGRSSPLRKRRGRGRGPGTFGRHRRR